jgi:uncharacterized protein (TIGR03792 family)
MKLTDRIYEKGQAVEYLVFTMKPELVDQFIELDRAIWTKELATCEGFVSKEVWVNKKKPGEITTILYWNSLEQWKAIDHQWLAEVDKRFTAYMGGPGSFTLTAMHEGCDYYRVLETVKELP